MFNSATLKITPPLFLTCYNAFQNIGQVNRIALLPQDLIDESDVISSLYFEEGYGTRLGIPDEQYLADGRTIFGWVHPMFLRN